MKHITSNQREIQFSEPTFSFNTYKEKTTPLGFYFRKWRGSEWCAFAIHCVFYFFGELDNWWLREVSIQNTHANSVLINWITNLTNPFAGATVKLIIPSPSCELHSFAKSQQHKSGRVIFYFCDEKREIEENQIFKVNDNQGTHKRGVWKCRGSEIAVEIWGKKLQLKSCRISFPLILPKPVNYCAFSAGKSFKD